MSETHGLGSGAVVMYYSHRQLVIHSLIAAVVYSRLELKSLTVIGE